MTANTKQPKPLSLIEAVTVLPVAASLTIVGSVAFAAIVPAAAVTDLMLAAARRRGGLINFGKRDGLQIQFNFSKQAFART